MRGSGRTLLCPRLGWAEAGAATRRPFAALNAPPDSPRHADCPWRHPGGRLPSERQPRHAGPQVTVEYERQGGRVVPKRVHTVLLSTQHAPDVSPQTLQADLLRHVVEPTVPSNLLAADTRVLLNPSGRWALLLRFAYPAPWATLVGGGGVSC
jgi:hypothetical protein